MERVVFQPVFAGSLSRPAAWGQALRQAQGLALERRAVSPVEPAAPPLLHGYVSATPAVVGTDEPHRKINLLTLHLPPQPKVKPQR